MGWKCYLEDGGWRLRDEETKVQFGEVFQAACRTPEWKSSLIVYEKYKRKYGLERKDLIELTRFVQECSEERQSQGKKCSNDYLTQMASAELKKKFGK